MIPVRMNDDRTRQILDRRRKGVLRPDAHLVPVELFGTLDPIDALFDDHLIGGLGREVQGVNDIIRIEFIPIVKSDAFAKLKLERPVV